MIWWCVSGLDSIHLRRAKGGGDMGVTINFIRLKGLNLNTYNGQCSLVGLILLFLSLSLQTVYEIRFCL